MFEARAHELLKSLGYPDVPVLVTQGPVVLRSDADVEARIDRLIGKVADSFCAAE